MWADIVRGRFSKSQLSGHHKRKHIFTWVFVIVFFLCLRVFGLTSVLDNVNITLFFLLDINLYIKRFNSGHMYVPVPKTGPVVPTSYVVFLLSLLCSVTSVEMRDECSFCCYWWKFCPSLFKLSFHIP